MIRYPLSYNPISEYYEKIASGEIVVCEKIKATYKKLVHDIANPGEYHYSANRANHVIEFAENFAVIARKIRWATCKT